MARLLTIFWIVLSLNSFAQNYPITGVLASFPPQLSNALAGWANSKFIISATTVNTDGNIDGAIQESRILVIVKKNGVKVCGSYTPTTAPISKFNSSNKIWSGAAAVALLGQDCNLPPGDYELSIQFWGNSGGRPVAFSEEKVQAFSIPADSEPSVLNTKPQESPPESDVNTGNKGGLSINFNGLGGILFGGTKKNVAACGQIRAVTRVNCAGFDQASGITSYNITMIFTNNPIEQVKSCAFVLKTITSTSKGRLEFKGQALPVTIPSTDTVFYTFTYTPSSAKVTDAQFTISGIWEGNAFPLELKPAVKLPACLGCGCGTWGNLTVANPTVTANAVTDLIRSNYGNGKAIAWHCGQPFDFNITYLCSNTTTECRAAITWDIQKDGSTVKKGSGENSINETFTPNGNGKYTITLNADCGGRTCPADVYSVLVKDCPTETPPNPPADPRQNPVTDIPKNSVTPVPINVQVNITPDNPKKKDRQPDHTGHFYYIIPPEYSGEVVNVNDTLFLQLQNSYAPNTKQLNYTIRNLAEGKVKSDTKMNIINNQGVIRLALPLQNSGIARGQKGMLIMNDYKRYYYISFKRN